jgi:His/Glu/Gln/Arg/opine family amino acid ABC transporter permease subunit
MEGVHTTAPLIAGKSQAQLILEQVRRRERQFTTSVLVSWLVLLGLLLLLFSGLRLSWGPAGLVVDMPDAARVLLNLPVPLPFGPLVLQSIGLDWAFIAEWVPYISAGVWQTIGISALSIVLATLLALLAALGRLSRFAPIYALSTFYVSLIRGTPLLLQVFFFFLALPQLGILLSGLWAGVLALGLNYGAYMRRRWRWA